MTSTKQHINDFTKISCLILGSLLLPVSSQAMSKLEARRTVIAGVVHNFQSGNNVLVVNYMNPLSDEVRFAQNLTESNGYFHTEHDYVFAQDITIHFGNRFISLFVRPGDSIFVNIDASELQHRFENAVTFSGDNWEQNREVFLWTIFSPAHSPKMIQQIVSNIDVDNDSPEVFLSKLEQAFNDVKDTINAFSERMNMSDFLKNWAYVNSKFLIANQLLHYFLQDKESAFNSTFDIFNENNFQTSLFQYHLTVCMIAFLRAEIETDADFERIVSEEDGNSYVRLGIQKMHKKTPEGIVRDFMLFRWLKNDFDFYDSLPDPKTIFSNDFFVKEMERLLLRKIQVQKISATERKLDNVFYLTNDGNIEEFSNIQLLNFLVDKHKGKVLYVDVWATWCTPCIAEFKEILVLKKHFENEDVVFVNLCLSSRFEHWIPTITKHHIGGENYFLDQNASWMFMADHNLSGYPSFLIIDKNGGIHNPAPRPSNLEAAIQKIESLK